MKALFGKLFGEPVEFSLPFAFLRQEIGLNRGDLGVARGQLLGPFFLQRLQIRALQRLFFGVPATVERLERAFKAR